MAQVQCPTCHKLTEWDKVINPFRPFCSERCRIMDLGAWSGDNYRIPLDTSYSNDPIDDTFLNIDAEDE
ncbi:MAG: zinc-binding protein [Francisellaceae bacterium]|nr:zinc-binding protein [Francisellaceae bacterium]